MSEKANPTPDLHALLAIALASMTFYIRHEPVRTLSRRSSMRWRGRSKAFLSQEPVGPFAVGDRECRYGGDFIVRVEIVAGPVVDVCED